MPIAAPLSATRTYVRSFKSATGLRGDCGEWAARTFARGAGADTLTTAWRLVASGQRHTQANGPQLLTELKTIALGPLGIGHTSNVVTSPARNALAFINKELGAVLWPDHTIFGSKPPADQVTDIAAVRAAVTAHRDIPCPAGWLETIVAAAGSSDSSVRGAGFDALTEFVDLGLIGREKLPTENRVKIDAALKREVSTQITARNYRDALAFRDELTALAATDAAYREADVKRKLSELQGFMDGAKSHLPDVIVLIEKPLQVKVGAASFDSYEIADYIGQGGMADVVLARKMGTGELYAVKILMEPMLFLRNEFDDEGKKIQDEFHHPNIVRGYGRGLVLVGLKERPFIVMENLPTALDRPVAKAAGNGKIPVFFTLKPEQKVAVARAVAEALNYAWNLPGASGQPLNYVHRDIKLGNILIRLSESGELLEVKLGDFGLARALAKLDPDSATRTGEIKGTPMYQPPELATLNVSRDDGGKRRIEKVSDAGPVPDIYSWGITLYVLLAHCFPPERDLKQLAKATAKKPQTTIADEYARFAMALATGEGRDAYELKERPNSIPEPFWRVILKALAIDPAQRYQSWDEVLAALDECARASDTLENRITAAFSRDPDQTSVFSFSAADAPRLAGLVPEKAYTINKASLEQARKDLAMISWLIETLGRDEPGNKYLPALRLNATAVDFWIRLKTAEIDPGATVLRLSTDEMIGTATVIAAAGNLPDDAMPTGHTARLEFAKTQLQALLPSFEAEKPLVGEVLVCNQTAGQTLVDHTYLPLGAVIASSRGGRTNNEDHGALGAALDPQGNSILTGGAFDGMGGHAKGEVASKLAAEAALRTGGTLMDAIVAGHVKLESESGTEKGVARMGTTAALFRVNQSSGEAAALAVGDSRLYLLRREGRLTLLNLPESGLLTSLRNDPKMIVTYVSILYPELAGETAKLEAKIDAIKLGLALKPPYEEEATNLINELTWRIERSPGMIKNLANPAFVLGHKLPQQMKEGQLILRPGDTIFACSDGVKLPADQIKQAFEAETALAKVAERLIADSLKMNGAQSDNVTVVAYRQPDMVALLRGQVEQLRQSLADAHQRMIELIGQAR